MTSSTKSDPFAEFNGNPPAGVGEIEKLENAAGFKLPEDYTEFLQRSNGGEGFIGPNAYVIFWPLGELLEKNMAYEVEECAPGLFIFGSDGGGEAFAFDVRTSAMPIVSVPFVGMEIGVASMMAPNFRGFLETLSKS